MKHLSTGIDCRGLSAPLAVLRIKQAIHRAPAKFLPLDVHLGETCDESHVTAGLQALSCDVRLIKAGCCAPTELALDHVQGLNMVAHV